MGSLRGPVVGKAGYGWYEYPQKDGGVKRGGEGAKCGEGGGDGKDIFGVLDLCYRAFKENVSYLFAWRSCDTVSNIEDVTL